MQFNAIQIAQIIEGVVEGNDAVQVNSFGKIEEAKEDQISFLANPKYEEFLYSTNAGIIIINKNQVLKHPIKNTIIRVDDAYTAFATLLDKYQQLQIALLHGIEEPSFISDTAKMGENVFVGAFAYIGKNVKVGNNVKIYPGVYLGNNVEVGENSILHPGVKIYFDCIIGKNVVIHAGTVIGSDGFGFAPQIDGTFKKVPQIGNVIIENNVEIGANTTIDRATIGSTIIKDGVKLDNLIQIAHNVEVGSNTVIAAQTGISGSTKIGKNVMIGGQTGTAGHIQIADGTKINGKSGITKSIKKPNTSVSGNPAYEFTGFMRSQSIVKNLPALEKRIQELEKLIENLIKSK